MDIITIQKYERMLDIARKAYAEKVYENICFRNKIIALTKDKNAPTKCLLAYKNRNGQTI